MILPSTIRTIFEKATIPLTIADATADDCPLMLANTAFLDLVGYAREDVVGRNCRFLQGGEPNTEARSEIRALLATRQDGSARLVNFRKSGERFEVLLILHPILRADGAVSHVLGSQYDVTRLRERPPEPHLSELGDIIAEANQAIRQGGRQIVASMQVLADVNANLIRRALAKS